MVTNRLFKRLAGVPNSRLLFFETAYANVIAGTWSLQDFLDLAGKAAQSDKRLLAQANAQQSLRSKLVKTNTGSNWQELIKLRDPRAHDINPQTITFDLSPDFAQAPPLAAVVNARSCTVSG
jgi:hypothetical protein